MDNCPICGAGRPAIEPPSGRDSFRINCLRCGPFEISGTAEPIARQLAEQRPRGRFVVSHELRRLSKAGAKASLDSGRLKELWDRRLPNPQAMCDAVVLYLGALDLPYGTEASIRLIELSAIIGTADEPTSSAFPSMRRVMEAVQAAGHIKGDVVNLTTASGIWATARIRLTLDGWNRYEQLQKDVIHSKSAFMAMGYHNPDVMDVVSKCFVPAVRETGFELFRLDQRPKSGIIDNRLRVEIRTARFLVCDLTDENRGAYWEAGFAEGLDRPVFYTCEKTKFEEKKTHFDTEHLFTVVWSTSDLTSAAEELKAAIRNEFPGEAIMPDKAAGRA